MIANTTTTLIHTSSTNIWGILLALAITGGIAGIAAVVGLAIWLRERESHGRPVIPWGARMRVERAKAHTEIVGEHLKQDAVEIKRLALGAQRDTVIAAIKDNDMPKVMALGLPSGEGRVEDGNWVPTTR